LGLYVAHPVETSDVITTKSMQECHLVISFFRRDGSDGSVSKNSPFFNAVNYMEKS